MPGPRARRVQLAPPVRKRLQQIVRKGSSEQRLAVRARIVLLAAQGLDNETIARHVGRNVRTVRRWRARFVVAPTDRSLQERPRSGRPATVPVAARVYVGMLACTDPAMHGLPRTVWSQQTLLQVLRSKTDWSMSRSEVCRTLASIEIKPQRFRQWLHSPDPDFQTKVRRICDLYRRPPSDAVVLCIDEKPGIQVLQRRFATHQAGLAGEQRREFEYIRHGTQALIAGLEVRSGEVFGQVCNRRAATDLVAFMEHVARRYPDQRVIVIWDNLNIHYDGRDDRWSRFNDRHGGRFSFVYTPKHASWVNQIEIWFSILERQLLKYSDFRSVATLREAIQTFIVHYNRLHARPFRWTFRGRFRENHPRLHRGATIRRCQSNPTPKTGKPTLSKNSFKLVVSRIYASAAAAQC